IAVGQRVISQDQDGKMLVWDAVKGTLLPQATVTIPQEDQVISPNRRLLALTDRNNLRLIDLTPPDTDELAYRLRVTLLDAAWHEAKAGRGEKEGPWFTAFSHFTQLLAMQPGRRDLLARRAAVLAAAAARDPRDAVALAAHAHIALADGKANEYRKATAAL